MVMNVWQREGGVRGKRRRGEGPHLPQEHHILPLLPLPDPSFPSACLIEGAAVTVKGF